MVNLSNKKFISDIYSLILPIINNLYDKYSFAFFEQNEYQSIVLSVLDIVDPNIQELTKQFSNQLEQSIKDNIKYKLLNPNQTILIISKYIEKMHPNYYNKTKVEQLNYLVNFLSKINFEDSIDEYIKLININSILNNLIKEIIGVNLKSIIHDEICKLSKSDNCTMLITAYCIINDIDIIDNNTERLEDLEDIITDISYTTDSVQFYLRQLDRPLLTKEQEQKLFYQVLNGNLKARDILIENNLQLVVKCAKKRVGIGIDLLDLIQEGNLGLMKAVDRFDVTKGYKFSTYATWWIRQSIDIAIYNKFYTIRIPVSARRNIQNLNNVANQLQIELGRVPTEEELAIKMNTSVDNIKKLYGLSQYLLPISINSPVKHKETEGELGDFILDQEESVEDKALKADYNDIVTKLKKCNLNDKEIFVLTLRLGLNGDDPKTLQEIGHYWGVTRERIRQIEVKALQKLRKPHNAKYFFYDTLIGNNELNYQNIRKLKKVDINKYSNATNIYDYFSEYSKEDIDIVLNTLTSGEIKLIELNYNKESKLINTQEYSFYILIQKIKKRLNNLIKEKAKGKIK